jgi:hypothetical protein
MRTSTISTVAWMFRTPDILRIWHYKRLDRLLRKQRGLLPLENEDDLPDPEQDPNFIHVLTEKQQAELKLGEF